MILFVNKVIYIFHKLGRKLLSMELRDKKFVINKRQDLGGLYDFILNNNKHYDGIILNIITLPNL